MDHSTPVCLPSLVVCFRGLFSQNLCRDSNQQNRSASHLTLSQQDSPPRLSLGQVIRRVIGTSGVEKAEATNCATPAASGAAAVISLAAVIRKPTSERCIFAAGAGARELWALCVFPTLLFPAVSTKTSIWVKPDKNHGSSRGRSTDALDKMRSSSWPAFTRDLQLLAPSSV